MISSASTLLLATLVFNAASVFGAPVRIMDTSSQVARAEINTPAAPVARAAIVDVQDNRRRSLRYESRRVARLPPQTDEEPETFIPGAVSVVPNPDLSHLNNNNNNGHQGKPHQRRYPRRILHDFYEKREPATSIKETTVVVTKNTAFDTPADAAAFAKAGLSSNNNNGGSVIAVTATIPGLPAAGATGVSTVLSVSQTTTVASPDASASASASTTASASATTSAAAGAATASASVSASSASSSASEGASATSTASAVTTTTTTEAASTNGGADSGNKKDAASTAAEPAVTVDNTGRSYSEPEPESESRRSEDEPSSMPVVRRAPAFSGAAWAAAVRRDAKNTNSNSDPIYRREFEPSPESVARRSPAVSGAAWASAVRRQVLSSSHSM